MSDSNASRPTNAEVTVDIVRFIDDYGSWPGIVEVRLIDVAGRAWFFHDKVPIFTCEDVDATSVLPQRGVIRCQVVGNRADPNGHDIVVIDTELPDHVETTTGETRFEVSRDQLDIAAPPK